MVTTPSRCPGCGESLVATRLHCDGCATVVEGRFELPALARLPADDLEFLTAFVLASGSLKELAQKRQQSYPTIRNRLDAIIERLGAAERQRAEKRAEILEAVAKRSISVDEGVRRLKES